MATRIDIKNTEFNRLFCENVKRMFVKKLKKRNISVSISIPEDVWLKDLYQGDMGSDKKFNIAMGRVYRYKLILTAQSNGEVYSEVLVEDKDFNIEMTRRGLTDTSGQVKRIGTSSAKEDIYFAMDNSFYLEDLNIITQNIEQNTMSSKEGMLSWETCVNANWALNITGQAMQGQILSLPASCPAPAITAIITTATVHQPMVASSSPSPVSLPMTPVGFGFSTPPPQVASKPTAPLYQTTPSFTTVMSTGRNSQPPILKRIQESLQERPQNMQTVQFLSNSDNFSVPPPSGSKPASSTPKNKQYKKQFKRKKIAPTPNFNIDSDSSVDITTERHIYESVEDQRQEYVPVAHVEKLVEEAIQKLLHGHVQSSSEEAENTIVSVPASVPEIVDLLEMPPVLQPVISQQNSKEKEKNPFEENETDETGEGPVTRSQSKTRQEKNE